MVLRIVSVLFLLCSASVLPATAATDPDPYESVNTLLLLIEGLDLDPGTTITAWSTSDEQIGSGTAEDGHVLVVVRGDEAITPDVVEGARPHEAFYLKVHPLDDESPYPLDVRTIEDVFTGMTSSELRFKNDAFYKLTVRSLPENFELAKNYPNPFLTTTTIDYVVPKPERVTLEVFNTLGQRVATLVNKHHPPGEYSVRLEASRLASGIYLYRLRAGTRSISRKMLVIR